MKLEKKSKKHYTDKEKEKEIKCTAQDLAKYIINERIRLNNPITNVNLQYILYYVQAFCLAMRNPTRAFCEEIIATPLGPIVMQVYNEYIYFGNDAIEKEQFENTSIESHIFDITNHLIIDTLHFTQSDFQERINKEAPLLLTPFYQSISNELMRAEFEFKSIDDYF